MREYFTQKQVAEILDVPPARVRQWQSRGLIKPAFAKGPVEYHRNDLVRMAVLTALAEVFEQPMTFIDAHTDAVSALSARLENGPLDLNGMTVKMTAPSCDVELKPAIIAALRERIAQISA